MDLKTIALKGFDSAQNMFLKDLEALPEGAIVQKFGQANRSVADFVYEVVLVNEHIAAIMRGEKPFDWPEGWITAPGDFQTREKVIAGFSESSKKVVALIESLSPEEMVEQIQTDDGETTRYQRCQFMTLHIWYHMGQLNLVQAMLGDPEVHW